MVQVAETPEVRPMAIVTICLMETIFDKQEAEVGLKKGIQS